MATLNLANLTKYTDQLSGILLKEAVLVGTTFDHISIQSGIKYADAINVLTNTLIAQAGGCGLISPTGSTTLSQRAITVCPIKIEESICITDFEQYWMGKLAKEGNYNEFPDEKFNEMYLANKVQKIGKYVEYNYWQGALSGTYSASYNLCQGILDILESTSATASVVVATASGALTTTTAMGVIDNMIAQIPTDILDAEDLTVFLNYADFRALMNQLRNNNYFVGYDGRDVNTWVLKNYTNTNVSIVATAGLTGLNKIILTPASNLYLGVDSFGEARNGDGFQFWYDILYNTTFFRAMFKMGAQVAFPQYVVIKKS